MLKNADRRTSLATSLCLLASFIVAPQTSQAVPSFARQTNLPCSSCHTTYPELTAFGRDFKLNAYTMTNIQQIESTRQGSDAGMKISQIPPVSAMLTTSITSVKTSIPDTQNSNVAFPQEFSLFFAGEITPNIGSFIQITYAQDSASFDIDNSDIRYADHTTFAGADTLYGITVNNNPTVEDPWNSTPAWGFPFTSSPTAPTPVAEIMLGTLGQDVAGIGAYTLWDNHLYANISIYRSAHHGPDILPNPNSTTTIDGIAPYWRLAWQQTIGDDNFEIGGFGMQTKIFPTGINDPSDKYTDTALDFQYEHPMSADMLTVRGSFIHEKQDFNSGAAANPSNNLDAVSVNGSYHLGTTGAFSLGYFSITGDTDTGLYAPNPSDGSANGSPDSNGYIAQATFLPWQNTQFTLQYTGYSKFNGSATNYDGANRNASDNDTLYMQAWLVW